MGGNSPLNLPIYGPPRDNHSPSTGDGGTEGQQALGEFFGQMRHA